MADGKRLVDLPGYGYAEVPEEMKRKWQRALGEYLEKRQSLQGLVVLMDIRHPLKDLDQQMIEWAVDSNIAVLVLLTKADKLASGAKGRIWEGGGNFKKKRNPNKPKTVGLINRAHQALRIFSFAQ